METGPTHRLAAALSDRRRLERELGTGRQRRVERREVGVDTGRWWAARVVVAERLPINV